MIYVLARSEKRANDFLSRHASLLPYLKIKIECRSYYDSINQLIEESDLPYGCIVKDDVSLSTDFIERINSLVQELETNWPNWGIVGNGAQLAMRVGYSATDSVRCFSDPEKGPNFAQHILPAQIINSSVMLLNITALRKGAICLPQFHGFDLYNIILSIETIKADLGVFIAPQLACWHGSAENLAEIENAKNSEVFNNYLLKNVRNVKISTLMGIIPIQPDLTTSPIRNGIDLPMASLRAAVRGRSKKTVAIVTRTQAIRPALLMRAIETIAAFIANAGIETNFQSYIITNNAQNISPHLAQFSTILQTDIPNNIDSRYLCVRFAARAIEADYFWFVDDDDWLFPNEAERLSLIINAAPPSSLIFLDSQHFIEKKLKLAEVNYMSYADRYFSAAQFLASISGLNRTPFCSVVFEREALFNIPDRAYETITYLEDFTTTLSVLLSGKAFPLIVDKLFTGISIRESGNTVTESDRTKWNKSMSEMWSYLLNSPNTASLLSLPLCVNTGSQNTVIQINSALILKVFRKLIRRELSVKELYRKIKQYLFHL